MEEEKKKELVRHYMERGHLVSLEFLESMQETQLPQGDLVLHLPEEGIAGQDVLIEKNPLQIVESYGDEPGKREVEHFVDYFGARYKSMERLLKQRQELSNLISIGRAKKKREKETLSIIGMVSEKEFTKTKNLMLTLEDPTGSIKVLVSKNKPELYTTAKDVVLDEVIGVVGANGENIIFANEVLWPDIPLTKELKKSQKEGYALFLSDLHVGSKNFLEKDFLKFVKWLNQETGNEHQKEIASKIGYIFIVGDLVDGCGIYPGQENDLELKNISDQYQKVAELLAEIPKSIKLIICPGNHDAVRMSEPQPVFYKDFASGLHKMQNVVLVSNPSTINIHADETFPGFEVLMYHGYSFDYYIANVDTIRNNGGYERADLVMKFLLQRRHLAPTHTSTLYLPNPKRDPLVIERIPDFFVTGHIHKSSVANYRNITLICGSCWQSKTEYQEKKGHVPEPSRVPIVNLQTREVKILRFGE
ncbi:MAG TPA: DNA-directed DNA polymerase II small subunit [Candidatus Nanoarchaeia archaeon]|nr:DNA-directed DNA polymerase II small subunit [Candidatus Nanoarchaeia archaeon]